MMSTKASSAAWLAPGCRLDRYDLLLQVAEGGMGLLWLARQQGKHGFDRIVAIKTILPKLASDTGFQRMFLDEARVVSRIEHPNVAQVLDLGEERGVLFLVMEWIDGESLFNVGCSVANQTDVLMPVGILTRIMVDACAGLHAAHELADDEGLALSVVHRDVSPHNLLVGFRGTTKVIDFGIAKARNRMSQETSIGLLKGKIAYMAPEQAMGNAVDRRTDVWSAGATMYRLLSGRTPYSASEPLAVLRRIAEGRPPAALPATVPEPVRLVVERALELDAKKRFETAHDMGVALETAMRAANIETSRDDVAAFMATHLGEGRAVRTREIEHAVRESRARMRVEVARTEIGSGLALPIVQNDVTSGAPVFTPESSTESLGLESGFDGRFRPSGHPTAILPGSQASVDANEMARTSLQEPTDSARLIAEMRRKVAAATVSTRVPAESPRPPGRWIAGGCALLVLIAAGFAWRAERLSRPIAASDGAASSIRAPEPLAASMSLPSVAPAAQATPPTEDPPAPAPEHARDPRALATPPVEPSTHERGSADDLLERARHARRAGRIGEAATLFAAAVEKAPTDSEALTGLAEVDDAQGATAKALFNYRRALAINPGYLPARLGFADSLWTGGQRDEARIAYRSIVDQFPTNLCPDVARQRASESTENEKTAK